MSLAIDIKSVVVCDDIRTEDNNKKLLIGVYTGAVIVNDIPAVLGSFALWAGIRYRDSKTKILSFRLLDPKGKAIREGSGPIKGDGKGKPADLVIRFPMINLALEGRYKIQFKTEGRFVTVSDFMVRKGP